MDFVVKSYDELFKDKLTQAEQSDYLLSLIVDPSTYSPSGEYELSLCRFYLKQSINFEITELYAKALFRVAGVFYHYKLFDECEVLLNSLNNIVDANNFEEIKKASYHLNGILSIEKGKYDRALEYLQKSKPVILSSGNTLRISTLHNSFGVVYYYLGNLQESLNSYLLCLEYSDESKLSLQYCIVHINISNIYIQYSQLDEAQVYTEKALSIAIKMQNPTLIAMAKMKTASILAMKSEFENGLLLLNEAIKSFEEFGPYIDLVHSYNLKADIERNLDLPLEALSTLNKSLEIVPKLNNVRMEGDIMRIIAWVFLDKLKDYKAALRYIQRYYEINATTEFKENWLQAHYMYAVYYHKSNERKKALQMIHTVLEDTDINQWLSYKLAFLELKLLVGLFSSEQDKVLVENEIQYLQEQNVTTTSF